MTWIRWWLQVFRARTPPEAMDLVARLLEYTPSLRMTPLQACAHSFFNELREQGTRLPSGRELPPLFNFTEHELRIQPVLNSMLIPKYMQSATATTGTEGTPGGGGGGGGGGQSDATGAAASASGNSSDNSVTNPNTTTNTISTNTQNTDSSQSNMAWIALFFFLFLFFNVIKESDYSGMTNLSLFWRGCPCCKCDILHCGVYRNKIFSPSRARSSVVQRRDSARLRFIRHRSSHIGYIYDIRKGSYMLK